MSGWQSLRTIPRGRDIMVKTVTGIVCRARVQNLGGIYASWSVRGPRYDAQPRIRCFRRDGRTSGDVVAVAWREIKADEMKTRAEILRDARARLGRLARAMKRARPARGYDRRGLEIQVADIEDGSGSSSDDYIELDLATARRLLPELRRIVGEELRKLGRAP